jgi:hypothetical protein
VLGVERLMGAIVPRHHPSPPLCVHKVPITSSSSWVLRSF